MSPPSLPLFPLFTSVTGACPPFRAGAHGWVARICQPWERSPSRSWLPIVEAPGCLRHPTSICDAVVNYIDDYAEVKQKWKTYLIEDAWALVKTNKEDELENGEVPRTDELEKGKVPRTDQLEKGRVPRTDELEKGKVPRTDELENGEEPTTDKSEKGEVPRTDKSEKGPTFL